uniref:Uncharacterized protein n=1 Tax=Panagrolaimus davidi TaxID=227884 RepID=A0A914PTU3_9BILA
MDVSTEIKEFSNLTKEIFHNKSMQIGNETAWKEAIKGLTPEMSAELGVYAWQKNCKNCGTEWTGNGSLKVLIIGNSHALCIVSGIKLAMNGMYSKLKLFDVRGTIPFEGFRSSLMLPEIRQTVKDFKPDIIYLIFKYMDDFEDHPSTKYDKDFRVATMQEMTNFLSNNSKVLFISKMHFEVPNFALLNFAEQIYRNGWINDYYRIKRKVRFSGEQSYLRI